MKLICIGDSIVNGYPFSRRDSWPAVLEKIVRDKRSAAGEAADPMKIKAAAWLSLWL